MTNIWTFQQVHPVFRHFPMSDKIALVDFREVSHFLGLEFQQSPKFSHTLFSKTLSNSNLWNVLQI